MSEHTPTPWKFSRTHAMSENRWYVLTDADGRGPIMDVGGCDVSGQIAEAKHLITNERTIEANAALIVRAVNSLASNEAKIEALTKALEPFALISSEGVVKQADGHVTVTTCAEYFHRAAAALSSHTEQEGK